MKRDFKKKIIQESPPVLEEPAIEEPKEILAEVCNVDKYLNVRSAPKVEVGNIVAILEKGTKIIVTDKKPSASKDSEWYKIKVVNQDTEGYSMKKYIKIL